MADKVEVSYADVQIALAKKKLDRIKKEREMSENHLFYFGELLEQDDPMGKMFVRNYWHVVLISMLFDLARENVIRFVTISMPPRSGKTYLTTVALAQQICVYPQMINMRNSYSAGLAVDVLSVAVRDKIKTNKKIAELYPEIQVSKSSGAKDRWKIEGFDNFAMVASGVGGTTSGIGCSGLLILDDEYQGMSTAMSEAVRRETEMFVSSVHEARKEKNFKGLMPREFYVCTRWTDKDTIGKKKTHNKNYELNVLKWKSIIESYENMSDEDFEQIYSMLKEELQINVKDSDDSWFVSLTIPALVKQDDDSYVSFSENYKSTKEWGLIKRGLEQRGEGYIWNSVYMQNPMDDSVKLFPKLKTFKLQDVFKLPKDNVIAYIDPAFGGGDHTAMPIAYVVDGYFYIVDVLYDRGKPEITKPRIISKLNLHRAKMVGGEGNSAGKPYLHDVRAEINKHHTVSFKTITHSNQSKKERILLQSGNIVELCYFLDDSSRTEEYGRFMNELLSATINLNMENDDATDSMAGLLEIGMKVRENGVAGRFSNW